MMEAAQAVFESHVGAESEKTPRKVAGREVKKNFSIRLLASG